MSAANRLKDLLKIELPIVQAPLAGVQGSALASAAINAGALGSLPCAMLSIEAMRKELAAIRSRAKGPINVNFFCHQPPSVDAEREAAWRLALKPYYDELGIPADQAGGGPLRSPFNAEMADALAEFEPEVVSFHFGLPDEALIAKVRRWGAKVLASATTVDEGLWLAARGVDAVIAQGVEAGGHRGMFLSDDIGTQVGTLPLTRQLAKRLEVPVIAAGGIADAQSVAAVLALGAAGAQVGTAYMLCPEATTSMAHRAALKSDAGRITALTNLFTGRPARGIVNRLMRELGAISPLAPAFPLAPGALAPLRAKAEAMGSGDFSPLWSGQDTSGCREIPAAQLTRELAAGIA